MCNYKEILSVVTASNQTTTLFTMRLSFIMGNRVKANDVNRIRSEKNLFNETLFQVKFLHSENLFLVQLGELQFSGETR